jgi:microcin C transport system substrate-binding protein
MALAPSWLSQKFYLSNHLIGDTIMRVIKSFVLGLLLSGFLVVPVAAELPENIEWQTNMDQPLIGSPDAIKGGTIKTYMNDYPLTFRLVGPNANDAFAGWNRAFTMEFGLVKMHPTTDEWIPWMATHWAVMEDNKTLYFKLRENTRFSDGEPITADDFVFTIEMWSSKYIVDPYYNKYIEEYFESVEAIDDYTLKVVGTRPSWRPLYDLAQYLYPTPRHATQLDDEWVKRETNTPQVAPGPYVVTEQSTGKRVVFTKVDDWWGEDLDYFTGLFNVDAIQIDVIPRERALDYFQRGVIDFYEVPSAKVWATELDFDAMQKGWAYRKQVFLDRPTGTRGLNMNLEAPIFQNKDFRKAMQYLFDFDKVNKNIMHNLYFRKVSAFDGSPYANPNLEPYGFNPRKAREHLKAAGFTKRGSDGILVNEKGERASFELTYGSKLVEPHMTVVQNDMKRAGVEMKLKLLDGATNFRNGLERKYEMTYTGRTASYYPSPTQYFHSKFVETTNNNNIWGFGTPETDKLIEIYEETLDEEERVEAMYKLDEIVQDEAFYLPLWDRPFVWVVGWHHVQWPDHITPKRTLQVHDWHVWWIDPDKKEELEAAKESGTKISGNDQVMYDPYDLQPDV